MGLHRLIACIHQQKAAGSKGILYFAHPEACLPKQRRLLVTCSTSNFDFTTKMHGVSILIKHTVWHRLGQDTAWDIQNA